MPIRDVAAMNASLDNDYGTTAGPNAPASFLLALFDGDPRRDGVEVTDADCPGYARVAVAHADFAAADEGRKSTSAPVQFPDATDVWAATVTHWGLYWDDGVTLGDCAPLRQVLEVTAAGTGPAVSPVIFYDDATQATP